MPDVPQWPAESGGEPGLMSCGPPDDPIMCHRGSQLPEACFSSNGISPSEVHAD